jgi:uncharacterized protein
MSDDVLEEYIRQHIDAGGETEVFFSWHGGEPTLAGIDFYRRAVAIEKRYAPPCCRIVNGIQTNATLIDDEWGRFFAEEGFYIGVSLDGPERCHNSNRKRADGRGTFDAVMRGLDILRDHGVPHEILCVISNDNVHAPLEVYRFYKSLGVPFITFLPLVERQSNSPAGVTSRSVRPADFGEFLSDIFDEWVKNDIGKIKVQIFEEALRTAFGQEHTLCIFKPVCGAVPVVEMNGDSTPVNTSLIRITSLGISWNPRWTLFLVIPVKDPSAKPKSQHCLVTVLIARCLRCATGNAPGTGLLLRRTANRG